MFVAMTKKQLEKIETLLHKLDNLTGIMPQDQQHINEAKARLLTVHNRQLGLRGQASTQKLSVVA